MWFGCEQPFLWGECCVTSQKMAAEETNKNVKVRKTVANLHATAPPTEIPFQNMQNPSQPQRNEDNIISMINLLHSNI